MSLDTEKLHRLTGKQFDKLYSQNAAKYTEMAQKALAYAQTCIPAGEKVRPGDVVSVIQNAVRIDPTFERHLRDKKLKQRFWLAWFAEYIVEQVFPQPELMNPPSNKQGG
jgi:hypothetical protein